MSRDRVNGCPRFLPFLLFSAPSESGSFFCPTPTSETASNRKKLLLFLNVYINVIFHKTGRMRDERVLCVVGHRDGKMRATLYSRERFSSSLGSCQGCNCVAAFKTWEEATLIFRVSEFLRMRALQRGEEKEKSGTRMDAAHFGTPKRPKRRPHPFSHSRMRHRKKKKEHLNKQTNER